MNIRHTKILATLGPATETEQQIKDLLAAGADAIRLNFSHGSYDWHKTVYERVRIAAQTSGRAVAVVQDLQGPKIRLGEITDNHVEIVTGSALILTTAPIKGTAERIPTSYLDLPSVVSPGDKILIDEGRIRLTVKDIEGTEIHCLVNLGGPLSSKKGIHIPGVKTNIPALTEKDRADAAFGLSLGVDYIALSFVNRAEDIMCLRDWMKQKGKEVPIIAKIETAQAMERLDEIVSAADGVMVARGDLGVESALDLIPFYQKKIIQLANHKGKLVITATQMLESMIKHNSPTRAELTDVANSILDGTDVMMLSGETAVGAFPIQTVRQMAVIAGTTEKTLYPFGQAKSESTAVQGEDLTPAIIRLISKASHEFKAKAIALYTRSGYTAGLMSSQRPLTPIFAFTPNMATFHRLSLLWGVVPRKISESQSTSRTAREMTGILMEQGVLTGKDLILALVASHGSPGDSNSIKIACAGALMQESE